MYSDSLPQRSPLVRKLLGRTWVIRVAGYSTLIQTFPAGSSQQQVSCYHYNNTGLCYRPRTIPSIIPTTNQVPQERRRDSSSTSSNSTRNLHSHVIPASITKLNYEVSCYGNLTIGDIHDHWVVEVVDDVRQGKGEKVNRIPGIRSLDAISQLPMPFCRSGVSSK